MTADDILNLALFAVLVGAAIAVPLYGLRQTTRQTRGTFGRPYVNVVADMLKESTRRSDLLVRLIDTREARIARLERRAEAGR